MMFEENYKTRSLNLFMLYKSYNLLGYVNNDAQYSPKYFCLCLCFFHVDTIIYTQKDKFGDKKRVNISNISFIKSFTEFSEIIILSQNCLTFYVIFVCYSVFFFNLISYISESLKV